MVKYSVIVPVYNEEKAILETISDLKKVMKPYSHELIIVNDCSKDRTSLLLSKVKGITVINHPVNKGYGSSLKSGIRVSQGEWIIITDADGTYPNKDIPQLIKHTKNYDMVVGSRTGKHVKVPLLRKPAKWILKMVAKVLTGITIPDLNSGLRVFKKSLAMEFWSLYPPGFSFTSTITIASLVNHYSVKYVPINYFQRKGSSSINPIKDFIGFNFLIFRVTLYFGPLKFFIPASIIIALLGVVKGIWDFVIGGRIGVFAAIIVLFAIQIFFFGMLADLVNKRVR
jgi:glycosyltransferase involved in cell wall biosynthesis